MIEPLTALAFSMQANRGVYAVLLGSGVSRSARIPTGYEITIDLIRKLAAVSGDNCEASPEDWYRAKFAREADYSELLDQLCKTAAERQQLLRGYLEASDKEREEGLKQPTAAHRSIAKLVVQGFIRVIVTTNFDRLMETALADAGVVPTVISSPDQANGALPLIHARCCVLKVSGDYLDTRIRNTPVELRAYPAEFDRLLDRIFDEFGLVTCGWSADWDEALRNALIRAPSRRFSCYWAVRGDLGDEAAQLVKQRGANVVPIRDADSFWTAVVEQVQSLEEFARPHPLSTQAAVASLKRYLAEEKFRIQLMDLVIDQVGRVGEATSTDAFACQRAVDRKSFTHRVKGYEAATETLLAMAVVGGYWAEPTHFDVWRRAVGRLSARRESAGSSVWIELQRYPGTLLMYAFGLGCVAARRLAPLGTMLGANVGRDGSNTVAAAQVLPPFCLFENGSEPVKSLLEGMERRHAPLNDHLYHVLKPLLEPFVSDEIEYAVMFDEFEMLVALAYAHHSKRKKEWWWAPLGAYGYRFENRERILSKIDASITTGGLESEYVKAGVFGEDAADCAAQLQSFRQFVSSIPWH